VYPDAGATCSSGLDRFSEALDYVRLSTARLVFEGYQKPAFVYLIELVVISRPSVDVDNPIGRDGHVPCVTDAVREDSCAKTGWQF